LRSGARRPSSTSGRTTSERYGQITDPFGHRWGLAQQVREVSRDEIARAAAELFGG
jgi:uncharacterized glyoxalase superfamily protein PhnB